MQVWIFSPAGVLSILLPGWLTSATKLQDGAPGAPVRVRVQLPQMAVAEFYLYGRFNELVMGINHVPSLGAQNPVDA